MDEGTGPGAFPAETRRLTRVQLVSGRPGRTGCPFLLWELGWRVLQGTCPFGQRWEICLQGPQDSPLFCLWQGVGGVPVPPTSHCCTVGSCVFLLFLIILIRGLSIILIFAKYHLQISPISSMFLFSVLLIPALISILSFPQLILGVHLLSFSSSS